MQPKLAAWGDGFIAALNDSATNLLWSTYLGGSGRSAVAEDELVTALAIDPDGFVYAAGTTTSADFPVQRAVQSTFGGGTDAFTAKLTPNGDMLVHSTFHGGAANETGQALVLTPLRGVHLVGQTYSGDLPLSEKPFSARRGANADAFLAAVCDPVLFASATAFDFYYTQGGVAPAPQKLDVTACAQVPLSVQASPEVWLTVSPSDSTLPSTLSVSVKPEALEPGDYTATFTLSTPDSWFDPITSTVTLHVAPPPQP
ncbi:MAG: SBBP repeat-containing protein [Acidobacteria bacterium]|nr:SBBP repeat-containing protein [Acidobacteriota bacterium]